ncbi:hypothetical protein ABFS83_14G027100 [Erythranthe nasuta]
MEFQAKRLLTLGTVTLCMLMTRCGNMDPYLWIRTDPVRPALGRTKNRANSLCVEPLWCLG